MFFFILFLKDPPHGPFNPESLFRAWKDSVSIHKTELGISELTELYQKTFFLKEHEKSSAAPLFYAIPLEFLPDSFSLILPEEFQYYYNPVEGPITSGFGWREKRLHKGIDVDLNKGDLVRSVADGTVRFAGRLGGFGNVVVIHHGKGIETLYAHLSKISVKTGQVVLSEQPLGKGGSTGRSKGTHLHFEIRYLGHPLNPLRMIHYEEKKLFNRSLVFMKKKNELLLFPLKARIYKSQKGDSWKKLAIRFQTSVKTLYLLNGITRPSYLKPGSLIRIE